MEKRGVIEEGRTPPEDDAKQASADKPLENHLSKRLIDEAVEVMSGDRRNPPAA